MTECCICGQEVDNIENRNGEMMCEECYNDENNYVFGDDADE